MRLAVLRCDLRWSEPRLGLRSSSSIRKVTISGLVKRARDRLDDLEAQG